MAKRDRSIRSSVTEQRIAEGRGKGTGASYNPWLHVQDVATDGRAWRIKDWKTGRDHHFLSDHEHNYYLIASWSQKVVDIREQFPLPLAACRRERSRGLASADVIHGASRGEGTERDHG